MWCGYNKGPTGPIQEPQGLLGASGGACICSHATNQGWRLPWKGEKRHSWAEPLPKGLRVEDCLAAEGIDASFQGGS